MAHILIADTTDGIANLQRILSSEHDLVAATTMKQALYSLKEKAFDVIVVGVHFDDSQMFDLIQEIRSCPKNAQKPLICFCSRNTNMTRVLHTTLDYSTRMLGAWMYLNQYEYVSHDDPDSELRRVFGRCLTHEHRKETLAKRLRIQLEREEIQKLREDLEADDWSSEREVRLGGLRRKLSNVLSELLEALSESKEQTGSIEKSRNLNDLVSEGVTCAENVQTGKEVQQSQKERSQLTQEQEISQREDIREETREETKEEAREVTRETRGAA